MGIFDWLGLGGKKPPERKRYGSQQRGAGHRGIGIGSTTDRDLSAENVAKWKMLSGDEVERFLYDQELLFVHSTNVAAAQYFIDDQKLMLEYLDGAAWMYDPISEAMAEDFVKAPSKGTWVWDNLRVRGEGGDGHHQPGINAVQIRVGSGTMKKTHGKESFKR